MQKGLKSPWTLALLVLLLLPSTILQAAEIKGVPFAEEIMVEETRLRVRGVALLKWAGVVSVYAGAFYLPEGNAAAVWNEDISKSLELFYFRRIKAEEFGSASDRLLQDNLSDAEYRGLAKRLKQFYGLFRDVEPGDRYRLIYRPDKGTELHLNDELLGTAPGADFAIAYFGIWLGERPIDKSFRDRLLGGNV